MEETGEMIPIHEEEQDAYFIADENCTALCVRWSQSWAYSQRTSQKVSRPMVLEKGRFSWEIILAAREAGTTELRVGKI